MRGVLHYMQRTALQGSPTTLTARHARVDQGRRRSRRTACIRSGSTSRSSRSARRSSRIAARSPRADIVNFAGISAATSSTRTWTTSPRSESLFERRVAHGYFVLSAAAGLFVDPAPGPVLANYGLEACAS